MKADNRYVPFLDGFRGYAILLVIFGHFYRDLIKIAQFGVTLFFFVSGFLITKLLIFEYNKAKKINIKEFYLRRIFRLYPALVFMLIVCCVMIYTYGYPIIFTDIIAGLFYFTNYYLVYFSPILPANNYPLVSGILWSLSVEEHFYFLFPFLFIVLFSERNKKFLYFLCVLLIAFLGIRILTIAGSSDVTKVAKEIYFTTHCRADSILYGCLSSLLIYRYNSTWYINALSHRSYWFLGIILLLSIEIFPSIYFQKTLKYSLQGIGFSLIIPAFLFSFKQGILRKLVENKLIIFIGKLSYSLYLFHWVARAMTNLYFTEKNVYWYLFGISATLILSLVSFYFVEKPFLRVRRKFGSNAA